MTYCVRTWLCRGIGIYGKVRLPSAYSIASGGTVRRQVLWHPIDAQVFSRVSKGTGFLLWGRRCVDFCKCEQQMYACARDAVGNGPPAVEWCVSGTPTRFLTECGAGRVRNVVGLSVVGGKVSQSENGVLSLELPCTLDNNLCSTLYFCACFRRNRVVLCV